MRLAGVKVYSGYILAVCQLCVLAAHLDLGLSRPLVDDRPAVLVLHRLPLVIGSVQHLNAVFAEAGSDSQNSSALSDYQRECQLGAQQESVIERWAKAVGVWTDGVDEQLPKVLGEQIAEGGEAKVYDHGSTLIKSIGLDYFILPIFALDRIALHNTYFPETRLTVLGFGRDKNGEFKIIVEQPFIDGQPVSDEEIADYMRQMGFELKNPRNWTYATPDIYLSDMHDENVIRSNTTNTIFVVDCDIRINTPELRQGGTRVLSNEVILK